jgi:flagellar hook protein FlgE
MENNAMSDVMNIALSALRALSIKQDVTANNTANMNTDNFKKTRAFLEESPSSSGVKVTLSRVNTPGAPIPPEEGLPASYENREMSNVDPAEELVEMIATRHAFTANIKSIQTEDEMEKTLLDIIV